MGIAGFLLFAAGVTLTVVGGAKTPAAGSEWPDTMALVYAGVALAVAGLVLWHLDQRNKARAIARGDLGNRPDAAKLLRAVQAPLDAFAAEIGELPPAQITARVDELLVTYVLPFAEARQQLITRFGMQRGAEILVTVAFGERMLNRVWSAAGDHHVVEARTCLPEAHHAFKEALAQLDRAVAAAG
jgi:hypothetical protein